MEMMLLIDWNDSEESKALNNLNINVFELYEHKILFQSVKSIYKYEK